MAPPDSIVAKVERDDLLDFLDANPEKWLGEEPPRADEITDLIHRLQGGLGSGKFQWLAACAIYPTLDWNLTVYLGVALAERAGRAPPADEEHWALVVLPWFRTGVMPEWLRKPLIKALTAENNAAVRAALVALIASALDPDRPQGFELEVAKAPPRGFRDLVESIGAVAPDAVHDDAIFVNFMNRREIAPTGLELPSYLRRLFGGADGQGLDHTARYWFIVATATSIALAIFITAAPDALRSAADFLLKALAKLVSEEQARGNAWGFALLAAGFAVFSTVEWTVRHVHPQGAQHPVLSWRVLIGGYRLRAPHVFVLGAVITAATALIFGTLARNSFPASSYAALVFAVVGIWMARAHIRDSDNAEPRPSLGTIAYNPGTVLTTAWICLVFLMVTLATVKLMEFGDWRVDLRRAAPAELAIVAGVEALQFAVAIALSLLGLRRQLRLRGGEIVSIGVSIFLGACFVQALFLFPAEFKPQSAAAAFLLDKLNLSVHWFTVIFALVWALARLRIVDLHATLPLPFLAALLTVPFDPYLIPEFMRDIQNELPTLPTNPARVALGVSAAILISMRIRFGKNLSWTLMLVSEFILMPIAVFTLLGIVGVIADMSDFLDVDDSTLALALNGVSGAVVVAAIWLFAAIAVFPAIRKAQGRRRTGVDITEDGLPSYSVLRMVVLWPLCINILLLFISIYAMGWFASRGESTTNAAFWAALLVVVQSLIIYRYEFVTPARPESGRRRWTRHLAPLGLGFLVLCTTLGILLTITSGSERPGAVLVMISLAVGVGVVLWRARRRAKRGAPPTTDAGRQRTVNDLLDLMKTSPWRLALFVLLIWLVSDVLGSGLRMSAQGLDEFFLNRVATALSSAIWYGGIAFVLMVAGRLHLRLTWTEMGSIAAAIAAGVLVGVLVRYGIDDSRSTLMVAREIGRWVLVPVRLLPWWFGVLFGAMAVRRFAGAELRMVHPVVAMLLLTVLAIEYVEAGLVAVYSEWLRGAMPSGWNPAVALDRADRWALLLLVFVLCVRDRLIPEDSVGARLAACWGALIALAFILLSFKVGRVGAHGVRVNGIDLSFRFWLFDAVAVSLLPWMARYALFPGKRWVDLAPGEIVPDREKTAD